MQFLHLKIKDRTEEGLRECRSSLWICDQRPDWIFLLLYDHCIYVRTQSGRGLLQEPAWVAPNFSKQAPLSWTATSCWHCMEIRASLVSLPSNSSQECGIWYHPKGPVCTAVINAPNKWGGSGLCRQAHSVGLYSSSTAVSRCVRFCISWGTVPVAGLNTPIYFIRKTTFRASLHPKLTVPPSVLSCTGEAVGVSGQESPPCSQPYCWGNTVRYSIASSAGGQTWNLN